MISENGQLVVNMQAYIITQNALADGTYLQYIRAHYNRSAQMDVDIFRNLAHKLDPDQAATRSDALERRGTLYILTDNAELTALR